MRGVALKLLGPWELRRRDGSPVVLANRRARALLGYLALRPAMSCHREALASVFWSEAGDDQARASLRQVLFSLRRSLDEESAALVADGDSVSLDPALMEVDVVSFERALALATPPMLTAAAALYRGPLLEGLSIRAGLFEDWLSAERTRLHELAMHGMSRLLLHDESAGNTDAAIKTALRMLALDPAEEEAHRALMRLYWLCGRRAAALRQYRRCTASLRRELDVEPSTETKELRQRLLTSPSAARPAPSPLASSSADAVAAWIGATTSRPRIGGAAEFGGLLALLDAAAGGRAAAAMVVGEAGIGKSRLAAEVAAEGGKRGWRVLLGQCHEMEQIFAFSPWIDLLRSTQPEVVKRATAGLGAVWQQALARLVPELGPSGAASGDGGVDPIRLFQGMLQLLEGMAAERPMLLLLEDVHWADSMSLRLLAFLCTRLSSARILIVITVRHEDLAANSALVATVGDLTRRRQLLTLEIPRLSRDETSTLTRSLLATAADADESARLVGEAWDVSQGNPFFVHEVVQGLIERGTSDASDNTPVPLSIRDLIGARLDRLGDDAQQLAAVAAAAGQFADQTLLFAAAGLDQPHAVEAIEELVRRHVLRLVGGAVDFTHDVIRRVVYGRLLGPRLKLIHRRLAEAIETLHATALDEHAATLAHHYRLAELWDKAAPRLLQAGRQSIARAAYGEAAVWLLQALEAASRMPRSPARLTQEIDVRVALCEALIPVGDVRQVADNLAAAGALAAELGDEVRLARIRLYATNRHWLSGQYDQALASGEFVAAVAQRNDDIDLRIASSFHLGQIHLFRGDYRLAVERFAENVAVLPADGPHRRFGLPGLAAVISRAWWAWGLAELGCFAEGRGAAEEAVHLAETADHAFSMADAYRAAGLLHLREGALDQAAAVLERGMALCQSRELELWFPSLAAPLGYAWTLSGKSEAALPLLEQAVQRGAAHGIAAGQSIRTAWLAQANLAVGRSAVARELAESALGLATARGEQGYRAWILHLLGEIAARAGDNEAAARCFLGARELAEQLGMRPLVAHCQLGLGQLRRKPSEAPILITSSVQLFREMGAVYWTDRATAALETPSTAAGD